MTNPLLIAEEVAVFGAQNQTASGVVHRQDFSRADRLRGAFLKGSAGLCVSVLLIAIPLLHFILVPLGLVITLILVSGTLARESIIVGGEGRCPNCGGQFKIFKQPNKFPLYETCDCCHRALVIKKR